MKQQAVQFSIRWKLLSIMIALLVGVLATSTYIQISNQKKILDSELALQINLLKGKMIAREKTLALSLARQVENGLATINLSQISETLKKTVSNDNELVYAILMDTSARAYIHTIKPELELELLTEASDLFAINQQQLSSHEHNIYNIEVTELVVPLQISTRPWGVLRLGFSLDQLKHETAIFKHKNNVKIQAMIKQSIYLACIFIVVVTLIILIISDRLSRPIRHLTEAANQLASGDFSVTNNIKIDSKDEIGALATAFSEMANDLKSSYLELQHYNIKLEKTVAERTSELVKAKDEAEIANRSKSDFLSIVSHEIRTPMNAIIGLTHLTLKTDLTTKQYDSLNKIKYSADSLLIIINDLLDMSKIEAGHLNIEIIGFNLKDVFSQLKTLIEIKAQEKNLDLHFTLANDIPVILYGDPLRLGQILLNLVSNAIKFTEHGAIYVNAELASNSSSAQSELELLFTVKDSGIGLTAQQQEYLFQPFSQADISTTRLYGGTGLGLSICKSLVELMGGTIHVESTPSLGSCFTFKIFLKQTDHTDSALKQIKNSNSSSQNSNDWINGKKILVVDDYLINQEVAKSLLEDKGFTVYLADSGQQAIQMIKKTHFDVILMDIQMPGMDGLETTLQIRSDNRFSNLPIIALTAYAGKNEEQTCLDHGMNGFLTKPIDIKSLLSLLKTNIKTQSNL